MLYKSPTIMTDTENKKDRGILWAAGAVATAIVASACCWLPLLLLAFGLSAVGVSATFQQVRPLFLGVTTLLLGIAFYFAYFRKQACGPGSSCAAPNLKLRRFNRVLLWLATAVVLAFAMFPQYVGLLANASTSPTAVAADTETTIVTLDIDGMTCEACAMHLQAALGSVAGVQTASVSYAGGQAVLSVSSNAPTRSELEAVIKGAGYTLK